MLYNTLLLILNQFLFVICSLHPDRGKRSAAAAVDEYWRCWTRTCSATQRSIRPNCIISYHLGLKESWTCQFREKCCKAPDKLTACGPSSYRKRRISGDSRAGGEWCWWEIWTALGGLVYYVAGLCCDCLPLISSTAVVRCPPCLLSVSRTESLPFSFPQSSHF